MYSSILKGLSRQPGEERIEVSGLVEKAARAKILAHYGADRMRARGEAGEVHRGPVMVASS